jgi:hypothetical protein
MHTRVIALKISRSMAHLVVEVLAAQLKASWK